MTKYWAGPLALIVGGVMLTGGVVARPPVHEPRLPAFDAQSLTSRYAESRQAILRASADDTGLAPLAAPGRTFLAFDPRGRAIEVVGDLARARRVAVLVPGADTALDSFDSRGPASPGGGARSVLAEARRVDPRGDLAVIAWLGYDTPATVSLDVATAGRADQGARNLRPLVRRLAARGVRVTLLCHSYGTVVCARAARNLDAADIAVFGSPGLTVSSLRGLHARARVWAGRARGDWMRHVPHLRVLGLGFGADPTSRGFGARHFATGDGGHSDYLKPGGVALHNLTLIALGRTAEVTP
jgi:Alpha/beta hydrolase